MSATEIKLSDWADEPGDNDIEVSVIAALPVNVAQLVIPVN